MIPDGIWIGLGGNLEGSEEALREAVSALRTLAPLRGVSSLYQTAPREYLDQPDFLNVVVHLSPRPGLDPTACLAILLHLEQEIGRNRLDAIPKGPRLIDLDLLLFGDQVLNTPELILPHPAMHVRRFVLDPLLELEPELQAPSTHQFYRYWQKRCIDQAIYSIRSGWYTA
jgi:2-amino-4-hydroxy-6-hydroxymethyldihydropteridine diphosphokinase